MLCCGIQFPIGQIRVWLMASTAWMLLSAVLACCLPGNCPGQEQDRFAARVITAAGSELLGELQNRELNFVGIDESGASRPLVLRLSEIAELSLVADPEADALSSISALIGQLGAEDYYQRQAAEEQLAAEAKRVEVRLLLEKATSNPLLEVRYRARRLLENSGVTVLSQPTRWEYDRVLLRNGTRLQGDAGSFSVQLNWGGEAVRLERKQLLGFFAGEKNLTPAPPEAPASGDATAQLDHVPAEWEAWATVDFETGIAGRKLRRDAIVTEEFAGEGLLFKTGFPADQNSAMVVSPYPFNFENKPAGGNSICVRRNTANYVKLFDGVSVIRFCEPGRPGSFSGVNNFGIYAARIDYPLSFVMQAMNSDGQLVGEVQSNDDSCVWFGIQSPEPIVEIRILSNPLGLQMDLQIDNDYALDHLRRSRPVAAVPAGPLERNTVCMRNGDLLAVDQIRPEAGGFRFRELVSGREMSVVADDVNWWARAGSGRPQPAADSQGWRAMLPDRSVIDIGWSGDGFRARRFSGSPVDRDEIVALWSARDWCRYPVQGDFSHGQNVLVFPACRIAVPETQVGAAGISWEADQATALFQPVMLSRSEEGAADPTGRMMAASTGLMPESSEIGWEEKGNWNVPTVWMKTPPVQKPQLGYVSLENGEQLSFGPGARFQIGAGDAGQLRLVDGDGSELVLNWNQVWRMKFPAGGNTE